MGQQWMKRKVVLLLLTLFNLTGCSSLLYYPTFIEHYPPSQFNLSPETHWIRSETGELLYGWYFHTTQPEKPKATVVFFHGNGENLSSHYLNLVWLLQYRYDFFIFDYGGYGRSSGKSTPESTVSDGKSVLKYLYKKNSTTPLVIFGQSLGGAVALRVAIELKTEIPLSLIAVDSSFLSYRAAARSLLSHHWLTWILQPFTYLLLSDAYAPLERVQEISPIPLIIIHGDKDQTIEISLGEEIYQLSKEPKEFWKVAQGTHIDSFQRSDPEMRKRFLSKLESLFQ